MPSDVVVVGALGLAGLTLATIGTAMSHEHFPADEFEALVGRLGVAAFAM